MFSIVPYTQYGYGFVIAVLHLIGTKEVHKNRFNITMLVIKCEGMVKIFPLIYHNAFQLTPYFRAFLTSR